MSLDKASFLATLSIASTSISPPVEDAPNCGPVASPKPVAPDAPDIPVPPGGPAHGGDTSSTRNSCWTAHGTTPSRTSRCTTSSCTCGCLAERSLSFPCFQCHQCHQCCRCQCHRCCRFPRFRCRRLRRPLGLLPLPLCRGNLVDVIGCIVIVAFSYRASGLLHGLWGCGCYRFFVFA